MRAVSTNVEVCVITSDPYSKIPKKRERGVSHKPSISWSPAQPTVHMSCCIPAKIVLIKIPLLWSYPLFTDTTMHNHSVVGNLDLILWH
jgi:hypothetical protein